MHSHFVIDSVFDFLGNVLYPPLLTLTLEELLPLTVKLPVPARIGAHGHPQGQGPVTSPQAWEVLVVPDPGWWQVHVVGRDVLAVWDAVPPAEVVGRRSMILVVHVTLLPVPPVVLIPPVASAPIRVVRRIFTMELVVVRIDLSPPILVVYTVVEGTVWIVFEASQPFVVPPIVPRVGTSFDSPVEATVIWILHDHPPLPLPSIPLQPLDPSPIHLTLLILYFLVLFE